MKRMILSHCFLIAAGLLMLFPSAVFADTTITCMPGNPQLQDAPLTPLVDEAQCNGDIGCLTGVRMQNSQITIQNNAIAANNTVMAGYRAQCDGQLAALKAAADAAEAQQKAQMLQNLAKALPGMMPGGGGGDKKGGDSGKDSDLNSKDDAGGKGNDSAKSSIEGSAQKLAGLASNGGAITSALNKYKQARSSCIGDQGTAETACIPDKSSSIADGSSGVSSVTAPSSDGTANQSSNQATDGADVAGNSTQNFISDCTPKNESCKSSCGNADQALDQLKSAGQSATAKDPKQQAQVESEKSNLSSGIQKEKNAGDKTSVAGKKKTCDEKNTKMLAQAADLLGKMAQLAAAAMATNAATAPTSLPTVSIAQSCNTPDPTTGALPQTPECICAANPRAGGCASASGGSTSAASMGGIGNDASSSVGTPATLPTAGGMPELPPLQARDASGSTPGGAAGGSPIGGGSGGFGGAGTGNGAGADGKKMLDANILGGAGGGGSSSGGGWGGGATAEDKYRDFLPGGKRDPASISAQAAAWAKEVSGGGGKSNWDKVKERYRDSNPTFIIGN